MPEIAVNLPPIAYSRLPPRAQQKARAIVAAVEDAAAALTALGDRKRAALARLDRARAELKALAPITGRDAAGRRIQLPAADSPAVTSAQRAVEEVEHEVAALAERIERLKSASGNGLADRIRNWLRGVPASSTIGELPPIAPLKSDGKSSPGVEVARLRGRLTELAAERATVAAAPLPSSIAKERAAREVAALAAQGRPDISGLFSGRPIVWPHLPGHATIAHPGYQAFAPVANAIAFAAWIAQDSLVDAICREIDREADDAAALAPEDRARRLGELDAEAFDAQRAEEAAIEAAAVQGVEIPRRDDAAVEAVLGVSVAGERRAAA